MSSCVTLLQQYGEWLSLQKAVAECQQKIAAFVQQVQQDQGMAGAGGAGRGLRLGGGRGGGMDLSSDMTDAEMARYMRTQGMQVPPGYRGGPDDMSRAMMMGGAGGPGDDGGGFFSMPGGASFFAPFARHPPNAPGMSGGPDRMGARTWQSEQLQTGGLESLGVGGPMRQGLFDAGVRDGGADLRPFDGRGDEDLMFAPVRPPIEQLHQQQRQQQQYDPAVNKSTEENRESRESKPRVVRFADDEPARQSRLAPAASSHVREAKACSVCQHTEPGRVLTTLPVCRHVLYSRRPDPAACKP